MKIEVGWFYFSIDRQGFHFEFGSVDIPTPIFTFSLFTKWWNDID